MKNPANKFDNIKVMSEYSRFEYSIINNRFNLSKT